MSADDDLATSLAKLRVDRLRYEGLPVATPGELALDFLEKLALSPDVAALEPQALAGLEATGSFLLALIPGNQLTAGLEAHVLGLAVHALLDAFTAKAKRDQAAGNG